MNELIGIFEYFEYLCWDDIKENIGKDYLIDLTKEQKKKISDFFDTNITIKKVFLASALRKFISRYIARKRDDTDVNADKLLIEQIKERTELWNLDVLSNNNFNDFIKCLEDFKVEIVYNLYDLLGGDDELYKRNNVSVIQHGNESHIYEESVDNCDENYEDNYAHDGELEF